MEWGVRQLTWHTSLFSPHRPGRNLLPTERQATTSRPSPLSQTASISFIHPTIIDLDSTKSEISLLKGGPEFRLCLCGCYIFNQKPSRFIGQVKYNPIATYHLITHLCRDQSSVAKPRRHSHGCPQPRSPYPYGKHPRPSNQPSFPLVSAVRYLHRTKIDIFFNVTPNSHIEKLFCDSRPG